MTKEADNKNQPEWGGVYAVSLGIAALIVSEFLPVSLLTPMAKDLKITEGIAGQAISVTAMVAMLSGLFIAILTQKVNRRNVMWFFCVLQVVSNVLVAFSPNFTLILVGRVLLGVGIGGFWSMAASTAMRLVPEEFVPKALSIIFGSVSVATVVAAPLGSFLGEHFGWRNVFIVSAALGALALVWQLFTLPSMPTERAAKLSTLVNVLKRRSVKSGMFATMLVFMAYAIFVTYLRPFLENVTGATSTLLSSILLGFGVANFVGTTLSRYALQWSLNRSLLLAPLLLCIIVGTLIPFGYNVLATSALIALWGMVYGIVQVGWTAWLTQTVPDETESAGGLQVAIIQFAIFIGAALGGVIYDNNGAEGVYSLSSLISFIAAAAAFLSFKRAKKYVRQLATR